MAVFLKIPVEPHRHGHSVVAANHNDTIAALDLEDVPTMHWRNNLEGKEIGIFR